MVENSFEWNARLAPRVNSYLLSFMPIVWLRFGNTQDIAELPYRRDEKRRLNAAIIDRIVDETTQRGSPLLFVVFSARLKSETTGWRETFLASHFDRGKVPWIDTRELLRYMAEHEQRPVPSYVLDDGHLNPRGNRTVADAVAAFLTRQHSVPMRTGASLDATMATEGTHLFHAVGLSGQ